jgi:hypothetical protein
LAVDLIYDFRIQKGPKLYLYLISLVYGSPPATYIRSVPIVVTLIQTHFPPLKIIYIMLMTYVFQFLWNDCKIRYLNGNGFIYLWSEKCEK